jgi:5-methylcytosine-specific restriction endonuclease McrA
MQLINNIPVWGPPDEGALAPVLAGTKRKRTAEYLAKQREAKAKLALKRRAYAIEVLNGCCSICGSTDRLEIDHKDRSKKLFAISRPPSEAAFRAELKKCQLLCYKHHRRKSSQEHSGEGHPRAKLTAAEVKEIRSALTAGETGRSLAKRFGVGPMEISRIKNGKRWVNEHHRGDSGLGSSRLGCPYPN